MEKITIDYFNHNKTWILSANTGHFNAEILIFNSQLVLILSKMECSEITQAESKFFFPLSRDTKDLTEQKHFFTCNKIMSALVFIL